MIEVQGLCKSFGDLEALKDISFTINSGEIVGFLGPNGAGKTTTMDILSGCLGADQGRVLICGVDILEHPSEAKKFIGYLPDEPPLYKDMTVLEYLRFAASLRGVPKKELSARIDDTLLRLDLKEVRGRLVGHLSKGFRQRVGLAQAIVHDPKVLILDEPTEGLDPNQIVQIRDLIKQLSGSRTVLLSSHILHEIEQSCGRFLIINKGRLTSSKDLGKKESLPQALTYFVRTREFDSALEQDLVVLEGVAQVHADKRGFQVKFKSSDVANVQRLMAMLTEKACDVVELRELGVSLEDVFHGVIKESKEAT